MRNFDYKKGYRLARNPQPVAKARSMDGEKYTIELAFTAQLVKPDYDCEFYTEAGGFNFSAYSAVYNDFGFRLAEDLLGIDDADGIPASDIEMTESTFELVPAPRRVPATASRLIGIAMRVAASELAVADFDGDQEEGDEEDFDREPTQEELAELDRQYSRSDDSLKYADKTFKHHFKVLFKNLDAGLVDEIEDGIDAGVVNWSRINGAEYVVRWVDPNTYEYLYLKDTAEKVPSEFDRYDDDGMPMTEQPWITDSLAEALEFSEEEEDDVLRQFESLLRRRYRALQRDMEKTLGEDYAAEPVDPEFVLKSECEAL